MARPKDDVRKEQLLAAVVDAYAGGGIGSRSLREVAAAVGTSHRMLLHHFDSREGLLAAVVEAVEARQRDRLEALYANSADPLTALVEMWSGLVGEDMRPLERLFFEVYARGASGEGPFDRMHPQSVASPLAVSADHRVDPELARLGLAVVRGLLLDLVATGDVEATTRAINRYVELVAADPDL